MLEGKKCLQGLVQVSESEQIQWWIWSSEAPNWPARVYTQTDQFLQMHIHLSNNHLDRDHTTKFPSALFYSSKQRLTGCGPQGMLLRNTAPQHWDLCLRPKNAPPSILPRPSWPLHPAAPLIFWFRATEVSNFRKYEIWVSQSPCSFPGDFWKEKRII